MRVRIHQHVGGGMSVWKDIDMPFPPTVGLTIDLGRRPKHEQGDAGSVEVQSVTFHIDSSSYSVEIASEPDHIGDDSMRKFFFLETIKESGWSIVREDLHLWLIAKGLTDAGQELPPGLHPPTENMLMPSKQ